jgi:hypothetical protein
MSWQAGFCVMYQGVSLRFAFAYSGGLWWAAEDLCTLFCIPESPTVIFLDLDPGDRAELQPYHTQVVNSAALHPWVETADLDRFHAWIRDWLFPALGEAFTGGIRDVAEAMAILHRKGVTAWPIEDDDSVF